MVLSEEVDTQPANLLYLSHAKNIFWQWKESDYSGLMEQTFNACIQTICAVPELAHYLTKKFKFQYVLPGKFSSDPIEGRFGWYRQVNGGNFFMSLKQVLEAEKKIRTLSLLQQHGLLAASKLIVANDVPLGSMKDDKEILWLKDFFLNVNFDDLSESDANIAFFVSGYIGRSICRRRRCFSCKALLVVTDDPPSIPVCENEEHAKLFEMADRGGLSRPTEYCYTITTFAIQCYTLILSDDCAKSKLFAFPNQRLAFVHAVTNSFSLSCGSVIDQVCSAGHSNFSLIVQSAFNCFAKNELKRFNAPKHEEPDLKSRKIRKITSNSTKI